MVKHSETIILKMEKDLKRAIAKRVKELNTDRSKYIRQCIISELIMKSQSTSNLKEILNP